MLAASLLVLDLIDKQPHGGRRHLANRLVDGGERWIGIRGEWEIIEGYQRNIVWHATPSLVDRADGADGHRVACNKDGGRRVC
jgi:hypothetical protein